MTLIQAIVSDLIVQVCDGDNAKYGDVTTVGQITSEYNKHLENVIF